MLSHGVKFPEIHDDHGEMPVEITDDGDHFNPWLSGRLMLIGLHQVVTCPPA